MQSVKFITLGCKANQYDTQAIREQFLAAGFLERDDSHPADIYIINTCSVTHKADRESLYYLHRCHRENPKAKLIITGCLTELDGDIIRRQPGKLIIVRNKDKNRILQLLNVIGPTPLLKHSSTHGLTNIGISYFKNHARAFLKVQDGCNNYCSYCKVPLVRGRSRSRSLKAIIEEAKRLVKNGYREIVLTGICLGAYGKDLKVKKDLTDVVSGLGKINGLLRIRLSSIEARDVSSGLIRQMSVSSNVCRHLHIPIQSGDDSILKKMNRRYSCADYLTLMKKIKNKVPQLAITTDVLVGFPGETEENFRNTIQLIKEICPLKTHIFSYSKRIGTVAAGFKDEVSQELLIKRMFRLKEVSEESALAYQRQFLGQEMEVLVESQVKSNPAYWEGHTSNYINVLVKSELDLNRQVIRVRLKEAVQDGVISDLC